jgi:proteasome lid subunit RPN8/RPN11
MRLIVAAGLLGQVQEHARRSYPNEACGLLVGLSAADRFIPIKNIAPKPHHYEMDPAELIAALRSLRDTGERLIGIFHSHPHGPAEPSARDIELSCYPEAAHLIVSMAEPERPQSAAFRIADGQVFPVELHVIV